jgi:hypothetical protein
MRERGRKKLQKKIMGNFVEQKLCKMFTSHRRQFNLYYVFVFSSTEKALPLWCATTTRRHHCYPPSGTSQSSRPTNQLVYDWLLHSIRDQHIMSLD